MSDKTKILLGLRNNAHRAQLIIPNGATKAVLGTNDPEEEQRRMDVIAQWGRAEHSPRQQIHTGIKIPLEQRTQTILYYQLSENERKQLSGGDGILSNSRTIKNDVQNVNLSVSNNLTGNDSD